MYCLLAAIVVATAIATTTDKVQAEFYEYLYSRMNYHNDLSLTHAAGFIDIVVSAYSADVHRVLDVGCSHGRGVSLLWEKGINASGVDISMTTIARARSVRKNESFCPSGACFQVGSAVSLPFADKSFDAIISTDVIEHVLPHEVVTMFQEFRRVTRKFMFLQISNKRTCGNCREYAQGFMRERAGHKQGLRGGVAVHSTVMEKGKWLGHFKAAGLEMIIDITPMSIPGFDSPNNFNFILRVL